MFDSSAKLRLIYNGSIFDVMALGTCKLSFLGVVIRVYHITFLLNVN